MLLFLAFILQLISLLFIYTHYGKGDVILSGVHFEYDPILMDTHDTYLREIISLINYNFKLLNKVFTQLQL